MSIINEALKKTEEYIQKNNAKDNLIAPKPASPRPFLLYILILLAGFLIGNFILNLLSHKAQANGLASNSQSHKAQANGLASNSQNHKIQRMQIPKKDTTPIAQAIHLATVPALLNQPKQEKKTVEPNFVLNGIFFSDNDGYALVNNQIVRKNDYVDGAKVGLISANTVELDNSGQKITLSTSR
jgi:hypothetical protein